MKKKISLLLSLCLLISLLAGCQQEAGDSPDSDTLVIATVSDIASLDPSRMTSSYELYVGTCVYDSLTWLPLGASEPAMRLAESYTVSDDGLTYTFTLRDGPLFHNGEPVTAEDVLYSVELFRSAAALSSYSYNIAGCESPDEKTVVITLSAPDPAFFENFNWCFVLPKAAHEEAGGDFGTQPVGSGPYQLVSYTAGTRTELTAFPDYYRGEAAIQNCEIQVIPDAFTIATALETGEVHYSSDISFEHIETLEQSGVVTCEVREALGCISAYGVHQNPPYDDVLIRQAISYAIDRDMCNEIMYAGRGAINPTPLPSFTIEGPQNVEGYSYDPDKARELLAEAGYPDGEGLRPLTIQTMDSFGDIAEVVQANLSEIGITAEIEIQESSAFLSNAATGNVDLAIWGAGLGSNASQWMSMFVTGGQLNYPQYSNSRVDELYAEAVADPDSARRQELYNEIFSMVIDEDAAISPIVSMCNCHAFNTKVNIGTALDNLYLSANPYDLSFSETAS